jgi:hypothetical protein
MMQLKLQAVWYKNEVFVQIYMKICLVWINLILLYRYMLSSSFAKFREINFIEGDNSS